ncbi:MAG TPA: hypothetical protein VEK39_04025 [Solirubrobacterales bacterium]|nr:hypothetical protein [Solirubrobacterales bacterium]
MPLSTDDYLLGVAELAVVVAALAFGAVRVRLWLLPGWTGAPARLVEALVGVAGLIWVSELLGAIGYYREIPLVVEAVVVGVGGGMLADGAARARRRPRRQVPPAPAPSRVALWIAVAAGALVAAHWSVSVRSSFAHGMYGYDTTWYHMPFAARFVQEASLTQLHFTSTSFLSWFYPANSELFHSVGILTTERDYLSPLLNVGWLLLAMLAAWCIGRPWGLGPASLVGACVVLGAGVFVDQPGEARNDIPATFFLLASAAVLVNAAAPRERPRLELGTAPVALAGLAAGLAIGTKLSLLAPIGALTLGIAVAGRRRAPTTAIWVAGLLAGGGFWFARNLFAVGNPLPWLSALGPLPLPGPEEVLPNDREPFSVFHYVTDSGVWSDWFFPGLADRLGDLWPLVLVLGALGALHMLFRERSAVLRVLGFTALLAAVAYPFTPLTASGYEGEPIGFASNLRYLGPVLALALALVPVAVRKLSRRWQWAALGALLVAFGVAFAGDALRSGLVLGIAVVGGVTLLAALAIKVYGQAALPRPAVLVIAALVAVAAVGVGYRVQRNYLEHRYATEYGIGEPGLEAAFIWARDVRDARIATITIRQYPYYGNDLSNHVQYVGHRGADDSFEPITSCNAWRRAINAGDYDYVVTGSNFPAPGADRPFEADWTGDDPAAKEIVSDKATSVFRLDGELDPEGCSRAG